MQSSWVITIFPWQRLWSRQREIGFLTVHSMLHLLGYDHEDGGIEAVRMREKEETVLTQIGWKRDNSYYMGDEE